MSTVERIDISKLGAVTEPPSPSWAQLADAVSKSRANFHKEAGAIFAGTSSNDDIPPFLLQPKGQVIETPKAAKGSLKGLLRNAYNASSHAVINTAKTVGTHTKGFLKENFTAAALGAGVMAGAKMYSMHQIRAADAAMTGGILSAVAGAGWNVAYEMKKDFKAAYVHVEQEKNWRGYVRTARNVANTFGTITKDNYKKYGRKLGTGAAMGVAGAWGFSAIMDNWDAIKDWAKPVTDFFGKGFGIAAAWFSDQVKNFKAPDLSKLFSWTKPNIPSITIPVPPQAPSVPKPEASQPELPVLPPAPVNPITEVLQNNHLTTRARNTLELALEGKSYAANEAIDGMINGRFGFEKNHELAVKLAQDLAGKGDKEAMLKLAYMQYSGKFTDAGVALDRESALATVKKLGKTWYGGESLLNADIKAPSITPDALPAPAATPEALPAAAPARALGCTVTENGLDSTSPYKYKCDTPAGFKAGDKLPLTVKFMDNSEVVTSINARRDVAPDEQENFIKGSINSIYRDLRAGIQAPKPMASL